MTQTKEDQLPLEAQPEATAIAAVPPVALDPEILETLVTQGDLSKLTPAQRLSYYVCFCQRCRLDPAMRPFEYIKLNGRLVLYARRQAADQLRRIHGVSVVKMDNEMIGHAVYQVTVIVQNAKGRTDTGTGVVSVAGLKGDNLANAMMKAETKAKRRATLSICGLGMLDETELETIPAQAELVTDDSAPKPSAAGALAALVQGGLSGPTDPPRSPPDTAQDTAAADKADARAEFVTAVQAMSNRDLKGWEISEAEAGDVYRQAAEMSGLDGVQKVAAWMADHTRLGAVVDGEDVVTAITVELTDAPKETA